jgi:ABC-type hemin transport system substrate-binding protein
METSQFEARKIALKQTKEGHVLNLAIHPDEIPEEILRDFVGARYMVVMVRLADTESPMVRGEEYAGARLVKQAGMICRDHKFWDYLHEEGLIFDKNEIVVVEWLCNYLDIVSRSELKTNQKAQNLFEKLNEEYKKWKN